MNYISQPFLFFGFEQNQQIASYLRLTYFSNDLNHRTTPASQFSMKIKLLLPSFLFFFIVFSAFGQQVTISGVVSDAKNLSLPGAAVAYKNPRDSSWKGVVTDIDGKFLISTNPGFYQVRISYIGYLQQIKRTRAFENVDLGIISLKEDSASLNEVVVEGKMPAARILGGDTMQYNSSAFKTNPDANAEDLVTKMPGISVQDGKVQAQGEEVKQVLVDGKPFFGEDPNATLKNIPAEIIDKIQVFDRQGDQAQFTGFQDPNAAKTINIITKGEYRNGMFGRVYGGAGDSRYKAGGNINRFEGKRRMTIIGQTNNLNEQNFASEDLAGVMSTSGGGGRPGGGRPSGGGRPGSGARGIGGSDNASNFLVSPSGGITQTVAGGINFQDTYRSKVDFTASYFFNRSDNAATNQVFRQFLTTGINLQRYAESSLASSINTNHRANIRLDYKIDSSNSILFVPRFSAQINQGNTTTLGNTIEGENTVNRTDNRFNSKLTAISSSSQLLYRHKFKKKGRTVSFDLNGGYSNNDGNNNLLAFNEFLGTRAFADTLNQRSTLLQPGYSWSGNVNYTEPLNANSFLMADYTNSIRPSNSEKLTYNVDGSEILLLDTTLSSKFNNLTTTNNTGLSYRYQDMKWQGGFGLAYQTIRLNNEQDFPLSINTNRPFEALLPNANIRYNLSKGKSLRLIYRTSANAPSISQLQEVVNNSNPLQLSTGNAALRQDFQQNLFLRYLGVNQNNFSTLFFLIAGSATNNYMTTSTTIAANDTVLPGNVFLPASSRITNPLNMNGYYSIRSFGSYSVPVKKLNISLNWFGTYAVTPSLINNQTNKVQNPTVGAGLSITSNISENLDFTVSTNSSANWSINQLQQEFNTRFFNQSSRFRIQWITWQGLVLATDLNHQVNTGLSSGFNQNFVLWNASVGKKIMNKMGDIRLVMFDLLNQNRSINRSVTDTYIEDRQTNILNRYFLVQFTYTFRKFKSKFGKDPSAVEDERPPFMRMGRPGGERPGQP